MLEERLEVLITPNLYHDAFWKDVLQGKHETDVGEAQVGRHYLPTGSFLSAVEQGIIRQVLAGTGRSLGRSFVAAHVHYNAVLRICS